jgi:hypothetical protein
MGVSLVDGWEWGGDGRKEEVCGSILKDAGTTCYDGKNAGFTHFPRGYFPLNTRVSFGAVRREFSE